MKKDIHPEDYRMVVFKDMSNDYAFLTRSCAPSKETISWEDGHEKITNSLGDHGRPVPVFSVLRRNIGDQH